MERFVRWGIMGGVRGGRRCLAGVLALAALLLASTALEAAVISVTGTGGPEPQNDTAASAFDIVVNDPRLIAATGNNVTFTLFDVVHHWMVDLTVELQHVGFGAAQMAFDRVLKPGGLICNLDLNGDYTFSSASATTLRDGCVGAVIPPGTYATTLGDDVTNSQLSSFWNGQSAAGTWRLLITDNNVNSTGYALNSTWTWQLDITVDGDLPAAVPEPTSLVLLASGLAGVLLRRRRRAA